MTFRFLYMLYCMAILIATFVVTIGQIYVALYNNGEIIVHFNLYGEHIYELIGLTLAIPGVFWMWSTLLRLFLMDMYKRKHKINASIMDLMWQILKQLNYVQNVKPMEKGTAGKSK